MFSRVAVYYRYRIACTTNRSFNVVRKFVRFKNVGFGARKRERRPAWVSFEWIFYGNQTGKKNKNVFREYAHGETR